MIAAEDLKPLDIHPTLAEVEAELGPASTWVGHCYEIANAALDAGLFEGRPAYGHWLGAVAPTSPFHGRAICRHGWIVTDDEQIIDLTRWVFTGEDPAIWIGPNTGEYDEGGNVFRLANEQAPPAFDPADRPRRLPLSDAAIAYLRVTFGLRPGPNHQLSTNQLFWLANLAPARLDTWVSHVYTAFQIAQLKALIPIDNWRLVMDVGRGTAEWEG